MHGFWYGIFGWFFKTGFGLYLQALTFLFLDFGILPVTSTSEDQTLLCRWDIDGNEFHSLFFYQKNEENNFYTAKTGNRNIHFDLSGTQWKIEF